MSSPSSSSNSNHNTTTGNHHWLLSLAAGGTTPNHPTTNDLQPVAATVAAPPTSNSTTTSSSALMSSVLDRLQLVQQLQAARRLETTATATPPRTTTTTTTTTSSSSASALAHQLLQGRLWIEQYQWLVEHTRLHKPLTPALQEWVVTQQANYARLDASQQRLLQLVGISGHPSSSTSTTNSSSGTANVIEDDRKQPATCTTTTTITAQLLLDLAQQRRDGSPSVATSTKTTTSTTNNANSKASAESNPTVVPSSTAGKTSKITSTSTTTNKHNSHATTTSTPHPHHAAAWNNMYHKLQEYHQKHGDCQVPQDYPPDPPLGRWVMTQRDQHHHGQLSLERYNALTQIGFCWRTRRGKPSCPKLAQYWHDKWTTMYDLLVAYVQLHGHAKVPYKHTCPATGVALGQWVSKQRKKYGPCHNKPPTSLQPQPQQGLYAAKERALLQELGVLGEDQRRGTSSTTTAVAVASSSVQQTEPTPDYSSAPGPAKKRRRRMETFFSDAGKKCHTSKVQPMPPPTPSSIAELQASVDQLWQRQTSIDVQDVDQVQAQLVQHQRLVQTLQSSCQTLRTQVLLAAGPQLQSPPSQQQQQQEED